jgi:integrase
MRESRSSGSVEGVVGNHDPYSDSGVDTTVIALWLGHESIKTTQIYLDAYLALKEAALAKTTPITAKPKRYRPGDELLAFLNNL